MAHVEIDGFDELVQRFSLLAHASTAIGKMAVYEGAKMITDEMRRQIEALPEEKDRHLDGEDVFDVITRRDKNDLLKSLGIDRIKDEELGIRTVVGFAGYGSRKTHKYKNGLPMAMLARSIESGSSVRKKHPFVRKTTNAKRKEIERTMAETVERQINRTMEGRG